MKRETSFRSHFSNNFLDLAKKTNLLFSNNFLGRKAPKNQAGNRSLKMRLFQYKGDDLAHVWLDGESNRRNPCPGS
jgi:hypothetical protein